MDYLAINNFVENSTRELGIPKWQNEYKAQHYDEVIMAITAAGVATGNTEPMSERTAVYIVKALNDWRNAIDHATRDS